jgi:hypothetical protein
VHRRPGPGDRFVSYDKPPRKPGWMTDDEYAELPATILIREVRVRLTEPGLRVKDLVLVTTLLDAVRYPPSMIAAMYGLRWSAEVNLRHLKQTLGLDVLRSHTLAGVTKELHAFVIIYNLVRRIMGEAGRKQKVQPTRISFVIPLDDNPYDTNLVLNYRIRKAVTATAACLSLKEMVGDWRSSLMKMAGCPNRF